MRNDEGGQGLCHTGQRRGRRRDLLYASRSIRGGFRPFHRCLELHRRGVCHPAQGDQAMSPAEREKLYTEFLRVEGYRPDLDLDGKVKFTADDIPYFMPVSE